jgi:hypothetical protein
VKAPDQLPTAAAQPLGMWDDELARPWLSLAVLLAWLGLLAWLFGMWPWGFAQ